MTYEEYYVKRFMELPENILSFKEINHSRNYIKQLQQENKRLKEQQKEFIEYLEKESKEVIRDAGYHQRICEDILEKYKEIVGSGK